MSIQVIDTVDVFPESSAEANTTITRYGDGTYGFLDEEGNKLRINDPNMVKLFKAMKNGSGTSVANGTVDNS